MTDKWKNEQMDGRKVVRLSIFPVVSVKPPLVLTCFWMSLWPSWEITVCVNTCVWDCWSVGTACPCEFKPVCVCVCGSPHVCKAVQSGVLSSRARLHTNTMWQGRNTSTGHALAHPPSHTSTPPATAAITPSPHSLPTPPQHAQTPLAVYFRHSKSSAQRQNHEPSVSSLPFHFTSPWRIPVLLHTSSVIQTNTNQWVTWDQSGHIMHYVIIRHIFLCSPAHPLQTLCPCFVLSAFYFHYLPPGSFASLTMNQGDSHSREQVIWHLRLSQCEPWPLPLRSWWVHVDRTRRNLNTTLSLRLNILMWKHNETSFV